MTVFADGGPSVVCLAAAAVVLVVPVRGRRSRRRRAALPRLRDQPMTAGSPRARRDRVGAAALPVGAAAEDREERRPLRPGPADRLLAARVGRRALVVVAATAAWLVVGGIPGLVAAVVVGAGVAAALRRVRGGEHRALQARVLADLPLAFDLFAACLRAGRPPGLAAGTVGAALGGPVGLRLVAVARSLQLGASPAEAWSALAEISVAAPAARSLARCADSGAALAAALTRLADDLRSARSARAQAAVRRAGVFVVLPLGLCFLPAFLCIGVVPLVIGVLAQVLP